MVTDDAEVHPRRFGGLENSFRRLGAEGNADCVEEHLRPDLVSEALETTGEHLRQQMDSSRDLLEANRAMIASEHRRHTGQERLRGADVAGCLFAADVLLAG